MGTCSIKYNKNTGKVEEVFAPNGQPSLLYQSAFNKVDSVDDAVRIWATAYTKTFKEAYGDWETESTALPLDENGEPELDMVMYANYKYRPKVVRTYESSKMYMPQPDELISEEKAKAFKEKFEANNPDIIVELNKDITNSGMVEMKFVGLPKPSPKEFSKPDLNKQKQEVSNILDKLIVKFPGASYEWINESDLEQSEHYEPVQNIKAFVKNNKIYLINGKVTPGDAIEEISHIFVESLRQDRPALFKGLLDAAKEDPSYSGEYENIKNWYSAKGVTTPTIIDSEFLGKQLGKAIENEIKNNPEGKPKSRFGKLIERFLEWLQSILGLKDTSPTGFSRMLLSEIAGYINTTGTEIHIPTAEYLYYSLNDPTSNSSYEDKDEIDHVVYGKHKNKNEKNKQRSLKGIETIDKVIAKIANRIDEKDRIESLNKIKANLQQSVGVFENGIDTISASRYLGSKDIEIINPEIAETGAKLGTFFHEALDELQSFYIEKSTNEFSTTPVGILLNNPEWFSNFLEKVIEPKTSKHPEIKAKDLLKLDGLSEEDAKAIFFDIVASVQSSLIQGDILLPELPILSTDLNGRTILSRIDYMSISKSGKATIYDLKTQMLDMASVTGFPIAELNNGIEYNGSWKDGADKELAKIRFRSKIDDFNMQTSLYSESVSQLGVEIEDKKILYVGIGTNKTVGGDKKVFTGKHTLRVLNNNDFRNWSVYGVNFSNPMADRIETTVRSRFRTVDELASKKEDTTKKENPFSLFSEEEKNKLINSLMESADSQITNLEKEIDKILESDLTLEQKNEKKDPIQKRIGTIRSVKETLENGVKGETPEDIAQGQALLIKIALDTFDHELDILISEVNEMSIPNAVDLKSEEHRDVLKLISEKKGVADAVIICVNSLKNTIENSNVDNSVKGEINAMLDKIISKAVTGVKTPFNKLTRSVVKAIIKKQIGLNQEKDNQFTKVMLQNKERLEPIIENLKQEIADIESGTISPNEGIFTKGKRVIGNLISGKNTGEETLEDKKKKLKKLEEIATLDKLDETTVDAYLDGIFNTDASPFYLGQTMSVRNDMPIDMDSLIASSLNPEMLINAVWQFLYITQEEALRDFQNEVYKDKSNSYTRETAEKVGGIEKLNEELTEMQTENEEVHQFWAAHHTEEFKNNFDTYEQKRNDLREKVKALEEEKKLIDKTDTAAMTAKDAEIKAAKEEQQLNELEFTEFQIKFTSTKLKPEAMRAQRAGGQLNHDVAALLNEQLKIITSKGTDKETGYANLTEEDIQTLEELEIKINEKKEELRKADPSSYERLKEYMSFFEFVPNWNYFEKIKKSMKETYGVDSMQYKNWLKRSTDRVPTKAWQDTISALYDQLAALSDPLDPNSIRLKEILDKQKEIKKKYITFGKFNPNWMNDEDLEQYNNLEQEKEEIKELIKKESDESIELGDADAQAKKLKRKNVYNQINAISARVASPFYINKRDELEEKVLLNYRKMLALEKELTNPTLSVAERTNIQNERSLAENQYLVYEEKFKTFFEKYNTTKYEYGSIAQGIDLGENYKSFILVTVPKKQEDYEEIPGKRFRIKRLKDEALNPDYQESFEPKRVGKGFYPMLKGVKFNDQTDEFEIDPANIPSYQDSTGATKTYLNPKFVSIQNDATLKEFYKRMVVRNFLKKQKSATGKPLGYHIPFSDAGIAENLRFKGIEGVANEMKQKIEEASLQNSEYEKAYNEYGLGGAEKVLFPANYRMNSTLNSRDAVGSLLVWNKDYHVNKKMAEASLYTQSTISWLENLATEIKNREGDKNLQQTNDKIAQIKNIQSIVEFETKKFVYGKLYNESKLQNKLINRKTAKLLMSMASIGRMAGDIPMQLGNLLAGNVQSYLSTCETRHATPSDYRYAKGWLYGTFFGKILEDYGKPIDQVSFETKMYRYWDFNSKALRQIEMNTAERGRRIANAFTDPLDLLMAGQDKGEFEIGSTTWAMILHHQQFYLYETDAQGNVVKENNLPKIKLDENGEKMTVSGLEILKENQDGTISLREDVAVTQEQVNALTILVVNEITRFQGNYAKETMSKFGGTLIGSLYNFYRKYLFPAVSARFSGLGNLDGYEGIGSAYSWSTQEAYRGWYTVLINMFQLYDTTEAFKAMALGILPASMREKLGMTTKVNSYYLSRAAMATREVMYAILFYMLYEAIRALVMSSDEDDLSYAEMILLKSLVKVSNESRSLVPVPIVGKTADYIDNFGQFTNAFKEGKTFVQLGDNSLFYLMYQLTGSPFAYERGFYQRRSGRFEAGDPKVIKNLSDLSGWSNIVGSSDPYLELKQSVRPK